MASSNLRAAASSLGDLHCDMLYDILLRLSAKDLCRLRAVCRPWRTLTSEPLFVAAHKSRHTAPLLALASTENYVNVFDIVDLSGNLVKQIPSMDAIVSMDKSGNVIKQIPRFLNPMSVLPTHLDLICFTRECHPLGVWVLNPATGATLSLPECQSKEFAPELDGNYCGGGVSCAFGQVPSTGEYKLIRVSTHYIPCGQFCEVITLDGTGTNHGRWRGKQGPPSPICTCCKMRCVAVNGVVYFLIDFYSFFSRSGAMTVEPGSIASFNLETEEWMETLRGPASVLKFTLESYDLSYAYLDLKMHLSLAELDGCLVTVHSVYYSYMDIWFLADFEKGIWVKKYNISPEIALPCVSPLLVLDDGRILFRYGLEFLKVYDPITSTWVDVLKVKNSRTVGICTGSLLSL